MTTDKFIQLQTLMSKAGVTDEQRHRLVFAFTGGRTRSSRDLTTKEVNDLVWKFQCDFNFGNNIEMTIDILTQLALKGKRSQVLAIATRCGIHEPPAFTKFNGWMKKSSRYKKPLNKYNLDELDDLLKQMHGLEANYTKSAEKAGTKAWQHANGFPGVGGN
jgi:hypothetical protein